MGVLFALLALTMTAGAGTFVTGSPGQAPGDWLQPWTESGIGYFDNLELFIETAGVYFSDAGSVDAGWTASLVNPQYVYMTGEDVTSIGFSTDFTTLASVPFTVDFYATCSIPAFCTNPNDLPYPLVVNSVVIDYNGTGAGGWNDVSAAPGLQYENTTPEPFSMLLAGTGLLALGIMSRKLLQSR
jgi:hypothetical protein